MLRILAFTVSLLITPLGTSNGQEAIALKASIPSINMYVPESLTIILEPFAVVRVSIVHKASGKSETFTYPCVSPCTMDTEEEVIAMISALNTANLTTRSLWRRVFDRLLLDFPARFPGGAAVQ